MEAIFDEEMPRARLAVLLKQFSQIDDGREAWRVMYPLAEVLLLLTCATIASCDDFDDIVAWGEEHGRDAAHKRLFEMIARGEDLPVSFQGRFIYYVGPVDPVGAEPVGPAGPTTATRMDKFTEVMLSRTGLYGMIGKAERGPEAAAAIARHRAVYLIAVGGAAVLISKAIKSSRLMAFGDLGMEAIYEFEVEEMPVTVAVDVCGNSIHATGPARWRKSGQA
jgi:tartrate/fumarate subfamily iron-sulfur-dependent hydro-lyase beta chain